MAVTMSTTAQQHVRKSLDNRGKGLGIRLGVRTTGCSGLSYIFEYVDEPQAEDKIFDCGSNVKVYIDPKSLVYLDGTELDFKKEGLNEGFVFRNPNATGECGCGESFHVN